uniref:Uncharacterized protein n=1 Tax=Romanomermis culicivorax TaxID=13658 RepID=A0A915ISH4_ROMCU
MQLWPARQKKTLGEGLEPSTFCIQGRRAELRKMQSHADGSENVVVVVVTNLLIKNWFHIAFCRCVDRFK